MLETYPLELSASQILKNIFFRCNLTKAKTLKIDVFFALGL